MELTPSWKRGRPSDLNQYFDADTHPYESAITAATSLVAEGWRLIKRVVGDMKKPVSLLETVLSNTRELQRCPKRVPELITVDLLEQMRIGFVAPSLNVKRWKPLQSVCEQEKKGEKLQEERRDGKMGPSLCKVTDLDKLTRKRKVYHEFKLQPDDSNHILTTEILQRNIRLAADTLREIQQKEREEEAKNQQTLINQPSEGTIQDGQTQRVQTGERKGEITLLANSPGMEQADSNLRESKQQGKLVQGKQQSRQGTNATAPSNSKTGQCQQTSDSKVDQTKEAVKTDNNQPKSNPFLTSPAKPLKLMDVILNANSSSLLPRNIFSFTPPTQNSNDQKEMSVSTNAQTQKAQNKAENSKSFVNPFASNPALQNVLGSQMNFSLQNSSQINAQLPKQPQDEKHKFAHLFNQPKLNPNAPMPQGQTVFQMPNRIDNKPNSAYAQPIHEFLSNAQGHTKDKSFSFLSQVQPQIANRHIDFFQTSNRASNQTSLFDAASNNSQRTEKKKYPVMNRRKKMDKGDRIS